MGSRISIKRKKEEEAESISFFLSQLKIDPSACDWSGERPDCKYTTPDGKVIGIEVVRCMNEGDEVLLMQNELMKACMLSEKELQDLGITNAIILVTFNFSIQRSSIKDPSFYSTITLEIYSKMVSEHFFDKEMEKSPLMGLKRKVANSYKYVDGISVLRNSSGKLEIDPVYMYIYPELAKESIERCIRIKETKLQQFQSLPENRSISEYWLVLTTPWKTFTQIGDISSLNIRTNYNRIYITDDYSVRQIV